MSSLIFNNHVVVFGDVVDQGDIYLVAQQQIIYKSQLHGAVLIAEEPPYTSSDGWSYIDGKFVPVEPDEEPIEMTPKAPAPTKEELLAQLQAIQAQIQAL